MNYIYIILIVAILFGLSFKSKRYLHMLQQNLYNENNRYLKWLVKNLKEFIDVDFIAIIISLVGLFILDKTDSIINATIVAISIIYIFLGLFWRKRLSSFQNKKPLVITARVKRLIFTMSILY